MSVLVIDAEERAEIDLLTEAIERLGHEAVVCDVTDWPGDEPLALATDDEAAVFGTRVEFEAVTGALVNCHQLFRPFEPRHGERLRDDPVPALNQLREYRGMFDSLCRILDWHGAEVVTRPSKHRWQDRKPWQLYLLGRANVPVPDTLFTNDPSEVVSFYESHDRVVYKPVTRGGVPHELTEADVEPDRLADLATAPVQFQEYVDGDDLRIYVVDGEVAGAIRYESRTDNFSFKIDLVRDEEVDVEAVPVPDEVEDDVVRAAELAGLAFAAADVRRRPDGTHAVLELNESPQFAPADVDAGQDVSGALAELLVE
ncbi:ATP-grasp domain-containing protein [Halorussus halobius]|uniref:ATP-grasp domain-containing protein n=1 Tax=Halorussus halobius TaxID=1710537 RepID=UPI0010919018|nr:ATP-grasp domain-containing protein [Halorussus halobius]